MPTPREFKHNHYVPEWYQRRFMLPGRGKYWYLDLKPEQKIENGHRFTRHDRFNWGPGSCFAENDLYTTKWGGQENVDIEKFFFGRVDTEGKPAIEFFSDFQFDHPDQEAAYHGLMNYMSVQKLRTPKGLGWLSAQAGEQDSNARLLLLQQIQNMYCATWSDCVWLIADATNSRTKFIISDHPVTVYNRACFAGSQWCRGFNDPDIRMVATHTYFPLSMEKILILTNLAWVRNPYQNERKVHPNPEYFRNTIFSFMDIQRYRTLTEQEVLEINYITKQRALRYIAAADKEWLYPERNLPSTHWRNFGKGLLLMPEPREIVMGGEVMVSYKGGGMAAWNEYGLRPWQKGYEDGKRSAKESKTLSRFQAEWAAMQGPEYRGTSCEFHRDLDGPYVTPEEFHQHDLDRARRYRQGK
jgi:hypothetical protein